MRSKRLFGCVLVSGVILTSGLARLAVGVDAPPAAPASLPPETIAASFKQAKATHAKSLSDAKAALLASIDSRIDSASSRGDLKTVTSLQTIRTTAAVDGSLPPDTKEPSINAAKATYDSSVKAANAALVRAYQSTVREYTKAHKIDEAQAVQAELDHSSFGVAAAAASTAAASAPIEPPTRFGKLLPPLFTASGGYDVAKDFGIEPAKNTEIMTKPADFLSPTRDWVFDIWVHINKKDEHGIIGIGDGKLEESITVLIRPPNDRQHHGFHLTKGDQWGEKFDDLREAGDYIVRIEKTGPALTFSVGEEKDGKFEVEKSRAVNDPHDFMPKLSDKSAHLFFSGGLLFKQYRLTFKTPAAPGVSTAPPPMTSVPAPEAGKKKKK